MHAMNEDLEIVLPGSLEASIIDEEQTLLVSVLKELAADQLNPGTVGQYDHDLISLRDQVSEAHVEDLAPLIAEMYRMQALGAQDGKGRSLPVDVKCPYFGHLKLRDGKRVRDVLIGSRGLVKAGSGIAIVDWRNAPVSRIFYCYDEGDEYDDHFGGRAVSGVVEARRTIGIVDGELRRVSWANGSLAKRGNGEWVRIPVARRPVLHGGAGTASRPPAPRAAIPPFRPGTLGIVGDESLREDKHLKEITALIDRAQFEAITRPDSGIVILRGGAGSGKTTVALHRAAYLHFSDPRTFSPKRMVVVVKSAPLTEYISRVLPSLDVSGTPVMTLQDWMGRTRRRVLPDVDKKYVEDVPASVARLKKHPAILAALKKGVAREADAIGAELVAKAGAKAKDAVERRWSDLGSVALMPRMREMTRWLESAVAERAGISATAKSATVGILRRATVEIGDAHVLWAQLLSDRELLRSSLEAHGKGDVGPSEIEDLVRWIARQDDDVVEPEAEVEDDRSERPRERAEAEAEIDHRSMGILPDDDEVGPSKGGDTFHGIDGRAIDDDTPVGKLDEHDDALLLELTHLLHGGLRIPGSNHTVAYEHVVVDEAQDLSPTDIAVLRGSLTKRESMTLAGDTAQKLIFDNGFDTWESMLKDVGIEGIAIDQLQVSYRSTRQIVDFSRHVLGPFAEATEPVVPRTGAPVEQFHFGSTGEAIAFLSEALRSLMVRERKANVAVVARYASIAELYYGGLRKSEIPSLRRVYGKEFSFAPGIDVVDIAQVKGLEYDYVVLVEANDGIYPDAREARHLLHIGATRAVHQLWVCSVKDPSPLLPHTFE